MTGHGHHVYYHLPHGTFRLSETRQSDLPQTAVSASVYMLIEA